MINSVGDAAKTCRGGEVSAARRAQLGPATRDDVQGKTATVDYLREANDGTLTMAMIETPMALAQVDSIAATPGIDALFIGPYDLSTTLSGGKAQTWSPKSSAPSTRSARRRPKPARFRHLP